MNETPDAVRCPAFPVQGKAAPRRRGNREPQGRSSIALHHLPNRRAPGERFRRPNDRPDALTARLDQAAAPEALRPDFRQRDLGEKGDQKAVSHRRPEGKTLHRHRAGEKSGRRDFQAVGSKTPEDADPHGLDALRPVAVYGGVHDRLEESLRGVRPGNGIFDGPAGFEDLAVEGPSDIAAHADAAQRPFHHGACVGKKDRGIFRRRENARDGGTQNAFLRQHEPGKTQEALAKAGVGLHLRRHEPHPKRCRQIGRHRARHEHLVEADVMDVADVPCHRPVVRRPGESAALRRALGHLRLPFMSSCAARGSWAAHDRSSRARPVRVNRLPKDLHLKGKGTGLLQNPSP